MCGVSVCACHACVFYPDHKINMHFICFRFSFFSISFSSLILTNWFLNNSYNIDVLNLMDLRNQKLLLLFSCLNMFHIVADSVKLNFSHNFSPGFRFQFSPLPHCFFHHRFKILVFLLLQFYLFRHSFVSLSLCVFFLFMCMCSVVSSHLLNFHFISSLAFYFIVVFVESFVSAKSMRAAPESLASPQSKNLPKIQPKMAMAMAIAINLIGICCCDNCGGEYGFWNAADCSFFESFNMRSRKISSCKRSAKKKNALVLWALFNRMWLVLECIGWWAAWIEVEFESHSLLIACSLVVIDFHHRAIAVLQPKPVHNRMNRVPAEGRWVHTMTKKKRSDYQTWTKVNLKWFNVPYHPQRWNFRLHRCH